MRCFTTPEATCVALCQGCSSQGTPEQWADWHELDPATLPGQEPLRCAVCGAPLDL